MRQIPSSNGVRESSNPIPGEANNTNPNNRLNWHLKENRTNLDSLNKMRIEQTVGRRQFLIFVISLSLSPFFSSSNISPQFEIYLVYQRENFSSFCFQNLKLSDVPSHCLSLSLYAFSVYLYQLSLSKLLTVCVCFFSNPPCPNLRSSPFISLHIKTFTAC